MVTDKTKKEAAELLIIEFLSIFIIGLALKGIGRSLTFSLVYVLLFFLPGLPLYHRFEGMLTRYAIINFFGLVLVPILYFLIGLVIPITKVLFVTIPLIVFAMNLYLNRKHFFLQDK